MRTSVLYILVFFAIILSSCSVTKHLDEGQNLYTGAEVKIEERQELKSSYEKQLQEDLEDAVYPKPNFSILGWRPRVWFYLTTKEPKGKGLRHFLKYKLGQEPVLFEDVKSVEIQNLLLNRLHNRGHFAAEVRTEQKITGKKKVGLEVTALVDQPYTIRKVDFPKEGDSIIKQEITAARDSSLLKFGAPYELDVIKKERERIEKHLSNQGYFHFSPEYLIMKVDSTVEEKKVDVFVELKSRIPTEAIKKYRIHDVFIYPYYSIGEEDSLHSTGDTIVIDEYHFIESEEMLRPKVVMRSVFFNKGEFYTRRAYDLTLNRLMNLGVYKFVNVEFEEFDSAAAEGKLNVHIYLTPTEKKSLQVRLQGVTQSNNMSGPELNFSLLNRNFLNGAERMQLDLHSAYEFFIGDTTDRNLNSYEYGGKATFQIPRFIAPFKVRSSSFFVPRTAIGLSYNRIKWLDFFTLSNAEYSFGYLWQEDVRKGHKLYPVLINYLNLRNTSDEFSKMLVDDPYLRRSYEDQLIPGAAYEFTYNTQVGEDRKNQNDLYFQGRIDIAGNLAYLTQRLLIEDAAPTLDTPYAIKGIPYAQFTRLSADVRRYWDFYQDNELVGRLASGVAIPYGNSYTIPFIRQFFVGGANSIRAFRPRTLGPGTYHDSNRTSFYIGQGGDIKVEANLEYRFGITGPLKGAVFLDAGNTWLFNPQEDKPGGVFQFKDFYRELAIGTGAGVRLDITFFVLRLDLGYPLRKPYLPPSEQWIQPGTAAYNFDDIVINLAIGYPF